ncbi:hypothetical protein ABID30_001073 [Enterococcus rotai]|uniref:Uncharacterized protein n=1 Tax=Enterococcus rotai TaxID=118060 RepID=A0A0U2ITP7_9ENTE|nr:immunoglobulin-like domain-containing protein [Enterococcus rotai]ALS35710.1 hypothetical protein ATZ35_00615 [Enterococcus rotai]
MKKIITGCLLSVLLLSTVPFQVYAVEKSTDQLVPQILRTQKASPVTPDSFKLGVDDYVTGLLDKTVRKIILYVNGSQIRTGKIFKDQTFEVKANDVIHSLFDHVEIVALNKSGHEIDRQRVSLESEYINLSAEDFSLYDEEIKGLAGNKMDLVSLIINNEWIRSVEVAHDDSFALPVEEDDIFDEEDIVEIVGSLSGKELARITVPVNPIDLQAELQEFDFGTDQVVRGKITGKAAKNARKAQLYVNRKRYAIVDIQADGSFEIKVSRYITNEKDDVKVAILNQKDIEIGRYQVTFKLDEEGNDTGSGSENGEDGGNETGNEETSSTEKRPLQDWFEDYELSRLVAEQLSCEINYPVSQEDLLRVETIDENAWYGVPSSKGLSYLRNLKTLRMNFLNLESDLNRALIILSDFKELESLFIGESNLNETSLENLGKLTNLKNLSLEECNLTNLQFASNLLSLEKISILDNSISDVSPLASLKKLTYIEARRNNIKDISSLNPSQISSSVFWSFSNQEITLEKQSLSNKGTLTLPIPIKGISGKVIEPDSISDEGVYENQQITWQLPGSLGKTTFTFSENSLAEYGYIYFNGTVSVPYTK